MTRHSFPRVWIHAVFGTKNREKIITSKIEPKIHDYLKDYLTNDLGCKVQVVNGMQEHVHSLFQINPERTITEVMKNLKGSSSHWINQNKFTQGRFAWQVGYGAFSVSESMVGKVYNYVKNQKQHHKKISFDEEYEKFLVLNGYSQTKVGKIVKTI